MRLKEGTALQGLLEEYRSLRQEIMERQKGRLVAVGFASPVVGALVGFAVRDSGPHHDVETATLLYVALLVLLIALRLEIRTVQKVHLIASYIRAFIEPVVEGLDWETRLESFRRAKKPHWQHWWERRPMAIIYFVLPAAISLLGVLQLHGTGKWWAAGMFIISAIIAGFAIDLFVSGSEGWRVQWILPTVTYVPSSGSIQARLLLRCQQSSVCLHDVVLKSASVKDGKRSKRLPRKERGSALPREGYPRRLEPADRPLQLEISLSSGRTLDEEKRGVVEAWYHLEDAEKPGRQELFVRFDSTQKCMMPLTGFWRRLWAAHW